MCGLSVYSVNQRIREIAIRRVFGASTARILAHLTTDYLVSVASGITIGLAISSLLLNRWLEYYAYKMDVNWMFYAWPGLIVSPLIAMAVGLQYLVSFRKKSIATLRRV